MMTISNPVSHNSLEASAATPSPERPHACQSYRVGDMVVTTVADGYRSFPLPDDFIRNASRDEINAALAAAGMPADRMTIFFNPVMVDTGSKRVLIDTGNGPDAARQPGSTNGKLMESLSAGGIDPGSIDLVVISHFHPDHVNGLVTLDGSPAFPNAEIAVPSGEWAFWMSDDEMARAPAGRVQEIFHINRRIFEPLREKVKIFHADEEVAPGITAVATPGHTHGHVSFWIVSGSERLFVQSDVTNNPALFARHPEWQARFDMEPDQAVATRRRIYDMLAEEKVPVQGFHYPFPGRGLIEADGEGYRVIPMP